MFSLIITIISIALVAALAVATIYYGGDAFSQGTTKAKASTVVNHMQQIAGANTLFKANTGAFSSDLTSAGLGNGYLASVPSTPDIPAGYTVNGTTNLVTGTLTTGLDEVCQKVNEVGGMNATTAKAVAAAADVAAAKTAGATGQFFCYNKVSVQFQG